ncbi:MAG: hypothetical protein ACQERJ_06070 [Bacillota bacterium]
MANAIYTFKKEVERLIDTETMKVWLNKKHGRRVEYLFKVGAEQFSPPNKITEQGDYVLLAQGITEDMEVELEDLFAEFIT